MFLFVAKLLPLHANTIAKAMYAQSDPDGNKYIILDELIDVMWTEDALNFDQHKITVNGATWQHKFTKGWKDGSTSWEKMSDLKESHPTWKC